ncbi:MAG: LacI family DNA-binding transcriptional regulator [Paucibacter sp.]|nr:LacI family DNA-binding transcriptional regulator [Roseateles sp.]
MARTPRAPGAAPTIVEVAEKAGVSIKTVSRVLNQEPGVHEKTRETVLQVVAELKYRPKLSARSLAGARSFLIGLLYYDPSAVFVGGVQQGATLRCREAGYHLVVESLHNDAPDLEQQIERMVLALRPDGMVLTPPLCDNPKVLAALRATSTPCVLIAPGFHPGQGGALDLVQADLPTVGMDDLRAAEEVTQLLIGLGHRRIAHIKGAADQSAAGQRYQGFLNAMAQHHLSVDAELVYQGAFTYASGVAGAEQLLTCSVRPTAVFAANDDMALGVLAVAQRLGLSVPRDLSIVGFDDSQAAGLVWPPLTTVRQPMAGMARAAVEMLISPTGGPAPHRILPHELIVRHSTTAPPA